MWDLETRSKFSGNGQVGKKITQSGQRVNKEWIYSGSGWVRDITLRERETVPRRPLVQAERGTELHDRQWWCYVFTHKPRLRRFLTRCTLRCDLTLSLSLTLSLTQTQTHTYDAQNSAFEQSIANTTNIPLIQKRQSLRAKSEWPPHETAIHKMHCDNIWVVLFCCN